MKRITILTGHYGSGKSEIAVNLAVQEHTDMLVDLDIINPYFRSRSVRALLESHGVEVAESTLENAAGSDLPFISPKGSRPFVSRDLRAVYDLGGTKHGAKIMMQYRDIIKDPDNIDFLVVININRMETDSAEKIIHVIEDLEATSQLRVTGLINNANMLEYTDEQTIRDGEAVLKDVEAKTGIPIVMTFVETHVKTTGSFAGETRPLTRYLAEHWL